MSAPSPDDSLARVESLIGELEATADAATQARTRALVQAVLELHAGGLARVLELVGGGAGVEALARDERVAAMLLVHGLHPTPLAARVAAALDQARPLVRARGAEVALVSLGDGAVTLRMDRVRDGTPSAALRAIVEEALCALAPDAAVEIAGPVETASEGFVPLSRLHAGPAR